MAEQRSRPGGEDELLERLREDDDAAPGRGAHARSGDIRIPESVRQRLADPSNVVPPHMQETREPSGDGGRTVESAPAAAASDADTPGTAEPGQDPAVADGDPVVLGSTAPTTRRNAVVNGALRPPYADHLDPQGAEPAAQSSATSSGTGSDGPEPGETPAQQDWRPYDFHLPAPVAPGTEDPNPDSGPVPVVELPPQPGHQNAQERPTALAKGLPEARRIGGPEQEAPSSPWSRLSNPEEENHHVHLDLTEPTYTPVVTDQDEDEGRSVPLWKLIGLGVLIGAIILLVIYFVTN